MKRSVSPANGRMRAVLGRGRLQQPQRRGADGDDAAAGGARGVERGRGLRGDLAPLGVHAVLARVLGLDGQEGAGAHVQRHEMAGDAARVQRRQQLGREVQAGGGRGDGALAARVDGLVALGVLGLHGALAGDVGRQRRVAQRLDGLVEIGAVQAEGELHLARLADRARRWRRGCRAGTRGRRCRSGCGRRRRAAWPAARRRASGSRRCACAG